MPAEITVRIVDGDEGRALNREFRGQDHATNVLTFRLRRREPVLGADLVLCAPVVEREAASAGHRRWSPTTRTWSSTARCTRRASTTSAPPTPRRMEARESEILAGLGFADPYAA